MTDGAAEEISREIERDCLRYPRNLNLEEKSDGHEADGV